MAKLLKPDYNIDQVQLAGEYIVTLKDRAWSLVVTVGTDTDNVGFVKQVLTSLDDGAEQFRVKYKGGWTNWLHRLDERTLNDVLSHINQISFGVPSASATVDGLMSAADKAKLDKIPIDADKSPDISEKLKDFAASISKTADLNYAPKDHEHSDYVLKEDFERAIGDMMKMKDFTTANIMQQIHKALADYSVDYFKGHEDYATKDDVSAKAIKEKFGEVDAAKLGGKLPSAFASRDHTHGEYVKRKRINAGLRPSRVVSGGSYIPNQEVGIDYYTNAGKHDFEAPKVATDMRVLIVNNDNAGVVTFKGFSDPVDDLPSTPGAAFLVHIIKVGPHSIAEVKVLRTGGE